MPFQPPVKRIFRTPVIWAVWTAVVGNYLIAQFLISYSNMYFAYVLGYPTMTASFLTAAPLASQVSTTFIYLKSTQYRDHGDIF